MNYSSIDPIINAWIDRDGLHLYTKYQDAEVGALVFQTRKEEFMRLALSRLNGRLVALLMSNVN
jgi:hypothetical protein